MSIVPLAQKLALVSIKLLLMDSIAQLLNKPKAIPFGHFTKNGRRMYMWNKFGIPHLPQFDNLHALIFHTFCTSLFYTSVEGKEFFCGSLPGV
jgi:hypothetical protein